MKLNGFAELFCIGQGTIGARHISKMISETNSETKGVLELAVLFSVHITLSSQNLIEFSVRLVLIAVLQRFLFDHRCSNIGVRVIGSRNRMFEGALPEGTRVNIRTGQIQVDAVASRHYKLGGYDNAEPYFLYILYPLFLGPPMSGVRNSCIFSNAFW